MHVHVLCRKLDSLRTSVPCDLFQSLSVRSTRRVESKLDVHRNVLCYSLVALRASEPCDLFLSLPLPLLSDSLFGAAWFKQLWFKGRRVGGLI